MAREHLQWFMGVVFFAVCAAAPAQPYPNRPVRMIVPFAAGGGSDIAGRVLAQGLTPVLGQTIVVDNRAGAGSAIGTDLAAKATPDGYTLLLGNISLAFNAALYTKLPYDALRDLAPISLVVDQPNILVVHPSVPAKTLKEFAGLARGSPGKLTYGSSGPGSGTHLAMELLALELKIDLIHVPYKGTGPALTAVLGNEIAAFLSTFASALPHVKAGRLRSLGVTTARRSNALPDAPTIAESGVPGFDYVTWYGVLAPAGTPRSVLEKLHKSTITVLNSNETKQRYEAQGMEIVPSSPREFAAMLKSETQKWSGVVRAAKIAPI
jgi:tripartite-type tricarboxylate transporter receptor subunit TctC